MGRKSKKKKEKYVYAQLIHFVVQQKIMQHCKAIIFQFKEKRKAVGFVFRAGLTAVQFLRGVQWASGLGAQPKDS